MARSRKSVDEVIGAALAASRIEDPAGPLAVAFSGGLDSTVLLHALVRAAGATRVVALHVHHGLQPAAEAWVEHAGREAAALGVMVRTLRAQGTPGRGDSIEQWARAERYRLLCAAARESGAAALFTAHHADDQLETVLLALARGAGLDGLTGIAPRDRREGVVLRRPLLELDRAALEADAQAGGLVWVEDPSNADDAFARSALRRHALPVLRRLLPSLAAQLPDALAALRDARSIVDARAAEDLAAARGPSADARAPLDRRVLADLPSPRRDAALRGWVAALGVPPPSRAKLAELVAQLVDGQGAAGELVHAGWRLVRHRDGLHALAPGEPAAVNDWHGRWTGESELVIAGAGRLLFEPQTDGLDPEWLASTSLRVAAVPSLQRLRPRPGGPSRTLKNLRQEAGLPGWMRSAYPGVWAGGRLLLAAPFGVDRSDDWPRAQAGVGIAWRPGPDDVLRQRWVQAQP